MPPGGCCIIRSSATCVLSLVKPAGVAQKVELEAEGSMCSAVLLSRVTLAAAAAALVALVPSAHCWARQERHSVWSVSHCVVRRLLGALGAQNLQQQTRACRWLCQHVADVRCRTCQAGMVLLINSLSQKPAAVVPPAWSPQGRSHNAADRP